MPVLALLLLRWRVKGRILLHLNDKADLGRVAEVADSQGGHFLDKALPSHFELVLAFFYQVFDLVGLQLHDRADGQFVCPLALVQVSQDVLQVDGLVLGDANLGGLLGQVNQLNIAGIRLDILTVRVLLGDHALLQLCEDGVQFAGCALDVAHGGF